MADNINIGDTDTLIDQMKHENERETLTKREAEEMKERYKVVFGAGDGRRVLGHILTFCHFGEYMDPHDVEKVSRYNVGLTIARLAGALDPIYAHLGMETSKEE